MAACYWVEYDHSDRIKDNKCYNRDHLLSLKLTVYYSRFGMTTKGVDDKSDSIHNLPVTNCYKNT